MTVEILLEDSRWEDVGLQALSDHAYCETMSHFGYSSEDWEVSLLACDDTRIATLNADFRDKDKATNVLSWPSEVRGAELDGGTPQAPEGPDPELGDIAISFDTCQREAQGSGKTMPDHVTHLLVHGLLHLLGYDHVRDLDATLMEGIETEILGKMGISDPYRE